MKRNGDMFNKIFTLLTDTCFDRVMFRFPKSKKKRIRKKWSSKEANWKLVPAKDLRIMSMIGPDEIMAVGHINKKQELERLNLIAKETEGPEFIFVDRNMERI